MRDAFQITKPKVEPHKGWVSADRGLVLARLLESRERLGPLVVIVVVVLASISVLIGNG